MYAKYREPGAVLYINNFQPKKHYVGVAWYQKKVWIPKSFTKEYVELELERVHWQSQLWVNGQLVDSCNTLLAPHRYYISSFLEPDQFNSIVLRVDNGEIIPVGVNAHSWGDQTMSAWNGAVGDMYMTVKSPKLQIDGCDIFPDIDGKNVRLSIRVYNGNKKPIETTLDYLVKSFNSDRNHQIAKKGVSIVINSGWQEIEVTIPMGSDPLLWDEYSPNLYKLSLTISDNSNEDSWQGQFGMREVEQRDNRFYVNGVERYFRGNVMCGTFPITGYASMELADWQRIFTLYKHFGLNHVRFHSWTPPKAAFEAADLVGLYLFAETDVWVAVRSDIQLEFLQQEGRLSLREYGNHPSFVMMGMGNELSSKKEITNTLLKEWKQDRRRVYSGLANSLSSITEEYEFIVDRYFRSNQGWPPRPQGSYFFNNAPSSNFLFGDPLKYDIPLISHEVGQHCSYPSLDQDVKYTGSQYAAYLTVARDQLKERGMLEQCPSFVKASGALQVLVYKNEIESYQRTPKHTGYQILQLEDFSGQGSALVGVLDYFYDEKGYVTAEQFNNFNGEQVLLAELPKFVWSNNEEFSANALMTNWSKESRNNIEVVYRVVNLKGDVLAEERFNPLSIKRGDAVTLGELKLNLSGIEEAQKLRLIAYVDGDDLQNSWDFWVYPQDTPIDKEIDQLIVTEWNQEVSDRLENGETLILSLSESQINGEMPYAFLPIYWTQFDKLGNSQSMGLICNPEHHLFNDFPTDFHTNWQWWELLRTAKPIIFDEFGMEHHWSKSSRPLLQLIDGWKTNRTVGVLAEAKYGKGKILITSMDLTSDLERRIVVKQFRHSLLQYIKSAHFAPKEIVSYKQVEALLNKQIQVKKDSPIKLITTTSAEFAYPPAAMADGKNETFWHSAYSSGVKNLPIDVVIELTKEEAVGGVIYAPRQDKRNGRIKTYQLYLSDDGKDWGIPIVKGEFNDSNLKQEIDLNYFHKAKYIKLQILSSWETPHVAISEIELLVQ